MKIFFIAILVLFVPSFFAYSEINLQSQHLVNKYQNEPNKNSCECKKTRELNGKKTVNNINKDGRYNNSKTANKNKDERTNDYPLWWGIVKDLSNIIVALGTIALCIVTHLMVKRNQYFSKVELRAYMGATTDGLHLNKDRLYYTTIKVTNHGKTPAKNVDVSHNFAAISINRISVKNIQMEEPKAKHSSPIISSGQPTLSTITDKHGLLTRDIAEQIIAEKMAVIVYGKVWYSDVFNERHTLEYRFFATGEDFIERRLAHCNINEE